MAATVKTETRLHEAPAERLAPPRTEPGSAPTTALPALPAGPPPFVAGRSPASYAATGDVGGQVSGKSLTQAAEEVGQSGASSMLSLRSSQRRLQRSERHPSRQTQATRKAALGRVTNAIAAARTPAQEAKRQAIRLEGLAQLVSEATGNRFTERELRAFFTTRRDIKSTSTIVIPDRLSRGSARHVPHQRQGNVELLFNTRLSVNGLDTVMSVAQSVRDGRGVARPVFAINAQLFEDLQRLQPEVITALEKLMSYASHDQFHTVFDDKWFTPAGREIDQGGRYELARGPSGRRGFQPAMYEYFLFAVARETFERAGPKLRARVLADAHLLLDHVEAFKEKLRQDGASESEAGNRAAYLLSVGISKNLFFIIDPGDGPNAPLSAKSRGFGERCASLESSLKQRLAAYSSLWKSINLQRAAHAPVMSLEGKPVSVGDMAALYLSTSMFASLCPTLALAQKLVGEKRETVVAKLAGLSQAGDNEATYALGYAHLHGQLTEKNRTHGLTLLLKAAAGEISALLTRRKA